MLETEPAAERFLGQGPIRIGQADLGAGYRAGDGNRRSIGGRRQPCEIVAKRRFEVGVLGAANLPNVRQIKRGEVGHGEARIGSADIGHQGPSRQRAGLVHASSPPNWAKALLGNAFFLGLRPLV